MTQNISRSDVCTPHTITPPPCKPPLEIIEQGYVWVLEEFQGGARDGTTYSTYDSQIDALHAGKERMDDQHHPCLMRWDEPDSVTELYWNPQFEELSVRYEDFIDGWVVKPETSDFLFHTTQSHEKACDYAKVVQREFDFKHLCLYDRSGNEHSSRDHRFLRYAITRPDVRFSEAQRPTPTTEGDDTDESDDGAENARPSVPNELVASIPDLTQVEILDGDSPLHRYDAPWGDEQRVRILALSPEYAVHEEVVETVASTITAWEDIQTSAAVATVLDAGEEPAPWVVSRGSDHTLADVGHDLTVDERITVLEHISSALEIADKTALERLGVRPRNVRVHGDDDLQATLSNWGIEWQVVNTIDQPPVTHYTAPEQIQGHVTETTCVYQLGAVAYWLLSETKPFADAGELSQAIQTGDLKAPDTVGSVPNGIGDIIESAMAPRPENRYDAVSDVYAAIRDRYG